jgi:hypothetical protein
MSYNFADHLRQHLQNDFSYIMNEGKNDNLAGFGSGQIQPSQRPRITPQGMPTPPAGGSSMPGYPDGFPWDMGPWEGGEWNADGLWELPNGSIVYPPNHYMGVPVYIVGCPPGAPCAGNNTEETYMMYDAGADGIAGNADDGTSWGGPTWFVLHGPPSSYTFNPDTGTITYSGNPPDCVGGGNCTGFPPGVYQLNGSFVINPAWVQQMGFNLPPNTQLVILQHPPYNGGYYVDHGPGASPRYTMFGGGNTPNAKIPAQHGWDEETGPGEGETWAEWWDGLTLVEQALIITLIAAGVIAAGWLIYDWFNGGQGPAAADQENCPGGDCGPVIVDPGGGGGVIVIPGGQGGTNTNNTNNNNNNNNNGQSQVWNYDNEDPYHKA